MRACRWFEIFWKGALLGLSSMGCGDDAGPVVPVDRTAATYENIWPAADGSSWSFESTYRWLDVPGQVHATAEECPPTPPVTELLEMVGQPLATSATVDDVTLRMGPRLADQLGQRREVTTEGVCRLLPLIPVDRLWWSPQGLTALAGGSTWWVFTDTSLARESQVDWGDFVGQHTRVVGRGRCTALGRIYEDCVECLSWCDWKPILQTNEAGVELGYAVSFWIVRSVFAPGLGPVEFHSLDVLGPDASTDAPTSRTWTVDFVLVDHQPGNDAPGDDLDPRTP